MRKNIKSVLIVMCCLALTSPARADVYTAAQLSIEKILPSLSTKTFIPATGGFVSNSTILEMAIENTVYPAAGGGAMKKIIPAAIKYGRWLPWAAAAFTAGYFIGDYFFTKWHEDKEIYSDGQGFYEWLEKEVVANCPTCDPELCAAWLRSTFPDKNYRTITNNGFYPTLSDVINAAGSGQSVTKTLDMGDGIKIQFVYKHWYVGPHWNGATWSTVNAPIETQIQRNDLTYEGVWAQFEDDMPNYEHASDIAKEAMEKMEEDYNQYYEDGTEPELPNNAGLIQALRDMLAEGLTEGDTVLVDDADDYTNVITNANDTQGMYEAFKQALLEANLDTTDDDKATPEEIAQGVDQSEKVSNLDQTLTDFYTEMGEDVDQQDKEFSSGDLPPELQGQDLDASEAYSWFQQKMNDIRSEMASKVQTDFSGSCAFSLDCGTYGVHSIEMCQWGDSLALMGNILMGVVMLMGIMAIL